MSKKLFILLIIKEVAALSLSNCGVDNTLEVVSGTNNVAVCSGLAGQRVEWRINLISVGDTVVGFCEVSRQCTNIQQSDFIASRPSDTESTLTITTKLTMNDTITCQTGQAGQSGRPQISCFIDTVIPAEGSCIIEFRRTSWVVFSLCNITRMYSARGRYSCQWYQIYETTTETPVGSSVTQITQVGERNFAGSCVLPDTIQMPRNDGSYSYRVTFIPGRNNVTPTFIGTNEILRPTLPVMTCNNKDILPENTTVICSCDTSNIGKPGGRLKFSKLYGTQTTVVNAGNYDVTRLDMTPQIVNRNDHGRLQFRCEWADTIMGNATGVSVGYVDQSVMKVNNRLNLSVAENQTVTFNCSADGRPTPSMSLINKGNRTYIRNATSPLTHTLPSARCEDTATYSCLASNGMGKNTTSDANLYVNCKPRLHSDTVVPDTLRPMKYNGQAVTQTFTIIAYPTPSNFSFLFWGSGTGNYACKSAVINITLSITCRNLQTLFMSTCTLSVDNMTNSDSAGVYSVSLTNAHGSVDLKFQVNVDGTSESETTSAGFVHGVGVGVGVIVAVIAILALLTVFCLWRKKQKLICVDKTWESHSSPLTPLTSLNKDVSEIPMETALGKPPDLYDPLRQSEIGQMPLYSDLSRYESIAESSKAKGIPLTYLRSAYSDVTDQSNFSAFWQNFITKRVESDVPTFPFTT